MTPGPRHAAQTQAQRTLWPFFTSPRAICVDTVLFPTPPAARAKAGWHHGDGNRRDDSERLPSSEPLPERTRITCLMLLKRSSMALAARRRGAQGKGEGGASARVDDEGG